MSLTVERIYKIAPFVATLGVEFDAMTAAEVRARLLWEHERTTAGGAMHGGALMALADASGAVCAVLNLPPESVGTTTIESSTHFLRAVREGHAEAVSRPLHVGGSTIVVETDLLVVAGHLCARTTQVHAVLMPR
jgi:uncharacterized protein (TIGR00369 family)